MVFTAQRNGVVKRKFLATIFDRYPVMHNVSAHGEPFGLAADTKKTIPPLRRPRHAPPFDRLIKLLGLGSRQNGVLEIMRLGPDTAIRSNSPAARVSADATSSRA